MNICQYCVYEIIYNSGEIEDVINTGYDKDRLLDLQSSNIKRQKAVVDILKNRASNKGYSKLEIDEVYDKMFPTIYSIFKLGIELTLEEKLYLI
jgi:hypothetical protein